MISNCFVPIFTFLRHPVKVALDRGSLVELLRSVAALGFLLLIVIAILLYCR